MAVIGTPVGLAEPLPAVPGQGQGACEVPALTGSSTGGSVVKPTDIGGDQCFFNCDQVFANTRVTPTIKRGSLVEFELHPSFTDPGPYEYQLQFGRTGSNDSDDWIIVGTTAFDVSFLVDDTIRVYGKTSWTHYRVCLRTAAATYFSRPVDALGILGFADRRIFHELLRAQQLYLKKSDGVEGFLLKRRLFGQVCDQDCVDFLTGEVTNSQCPACFGSGFVGGYFSPIPCVYAALERKISHNDLDGGKSRGTVDDALRVKARMLAIPQMFENDVWVDKKNDHRWYIHQIEHASEYRGIPVAANVELRFAPFTDPIYDLEIDALLPEELLPV